MVKNAKNPRYWSKSNMIGMFFNSGTKISKSKLLFQGVFKKICAINAQTILACPHVRSLPQYYPTLYSLEQYLCLIYFRLSKIKSRVRFLFKFSLKAILVWVKSTARPKSFKRFMAASDSIVTFPVNKVSIDNPFLCRL